MGIIPPFAWGEVNAPFLWKNLPILLMIDQEQKCFLPFGDSSSALLKLM